MGRRIDAYKKYQNKLNIIGYPENQSWVQCSIDEKTDNVILDRVHCGNPNVIIPEFVQSINNKNFILWNIPDKSLTYKIIYNGNWEMTNSLNAMFLFQHFQHLDLTEFSFNDIQSLAYFLQEAKNLTTVKFGKATLNSLVDIIYMCSRCDSLMYIDMSELQMPNLNYMVGAFRDTPIKKLIYQE